ncbi:MAG: OmpA family protein [Alphaproteobacteria bacterium]|nr:OmpA family protein [Alphaproteobacteria bacterium]
MSRHWHRKTHTQQNHADDWLMTYADVITLLLCFFAVFLFASLSLVRQKGEGQVPLPPPMVHVVSQPSYTGQETLPPQIVEPLDVQEPPPPPSFMGNLPFHDPMFDMDPPAVNPPAVTQDPVMPIMMTCHEIELPEDSTVSAPVPQSSPVDSKTDKITVLEMDSSTFFDSGSATMSPSGKDVLQGILTKIESDQFKEYRVTVEGHTDDTPINTMAFPSNWELSTARASAVVHFFLERGVAPQRLRAAGYADTFPILPNRDEAGKPVLEHQAKNRRVVIKLDRIEKGE